MVLFAQELGGRPVPDPRRPPALLVHGFTQNSQCWGSFGAKLGESGITVGVDAPGHGASDHDDVDLAEAGRLCIEVGGPGHWVGYSMGGRMLLHAAFAAPSAFESLTLIGATAGIRDPNERAARIERDEALADRIEAVGVESFLDEWLAGPLFADLSADQSCRAERLKNRAEGLAGSLRNCGTGTQLPLWDQLHALDMPVLVVAGTDDRKFSDLGRELVTTIGPNARFENVHGGHAVHLENPSACAQTLTDFWTSLS